MAFASPELKITTLEILQKRAKIADENIRVLNLKDRIKVLTTDALSYTPTETYDLILIDGPKGQNKALFQRFLPYLNTQGYVLIDNLDFHGETQNKSSTQSRDLKQLVRKINAFKTWILSQCDLNVIVLDIGDGLMLISRKY